MIETTGVSLSLFHVNGISAGAHVAGTVGQYFRERHNSAKLIPRITGLDPANFIPDLSVNDGRIDATDGAFVGNLVILYITFIHHLNVLL